MLSYERQARIVQLIQQRVSVSVSELSQNLDVSSMTIRRDVRELERKGLVVRIHGGVTMPDAPVASREQERETISISQKAAIGSHAVAG